MRASAGPARHRAGTGVWSGAPRAPMPRRTRHQHESQESADPHAAPAQWDADQEMAPPALAQLRAHQVADQRIKAAVRLDQLVACETQRERSSSACRRRTVPWPVDRAPGRRWARRSPAGKGNASTNSRTLMSLNAKRSIRVAEPYSSVSPHCRPRRHCGRATAPRSAAMPSRRRAGASPPPPARTQTPKAVGCDQSGDDRGQHHE